MRLRAHDVLPRSAPDLALREATLDAMSMARAPGRAEALRAAGETLPGWLEFAERNRVQPLVAHLLLEAFGDDHPLSSACREAHDASAARMDVLMGELDGAAEALAGEGIRLVALKNAGIARGLHPCRACCPMGDVDVLVDRTRFRQAHQVLSALDFALASRSSVEEADLESMFASGGTEYRKLVDGVEVWFELQWRPVAGRWIRPDQEPDGAELIERSVTIPGTAARLLAPEDNMLQVALHTAKHSYVRAPGLRLHTDVDRLAHHAAPDWEQVIRRTRDLQVRTAVYFSLALAEALLGSPVPPTVLQALAPPDWKRELICSWLRRVDVFEPDQRKFNRPAMLGFHGLLYDDAGGLLASALDTTRSRLEGGGLRSNIRRGARRLWDLATRYEAS